MNRNFDRLSKRDHRNNIMFNIPKYSDSINNYKYTKKYRKYKNLRLD